MYNRKKIFRVTRNYKIVKEFKNEDEAVDFINKNLRLEPGVIWDLETIIMEGD